MSDADNIRLHIQSQPTIEQGIAALLQAVTTAMRNALSGHSDAIAALVENIDAAPEQWHAAVLANTPSAIITAGSMATPVPGPSYVKDSFVAHGAAGWQEPPSAPPHDEVVPAQPEEDTTDDGSGDTKGSRKKAAASDK